VPKNKKHALRAAWGKGIVGVQVSDSSPLRGGRRTAVNRRSQVVGNSRGSFYTVARRGGELGIAGRGKKSKSTSILRKVQTPTVITEARKTGGQGPVGPVIADGLSRRVQKRGRLSSVKGQGGNQLHFWAQDAQIGKGCAWSWITQTLGTQ